MTSIDSLYALVAVLLVAAAAIPAVRAKRRWRRLMKHRHVAAPRSARPGRPIWTLAAMSGSWSIVGVAGIAGGGFVLGGPVAGAVLCCYGVAAIVLVARRGRAQAESRSRVAAVDAVAALAAELRAGVAVTSALDTVRAGIEGPDVVGRGAETVRRRLVAAVDLAETSGAPLADVLDRLDAHLRAAERARATAEAQAAGALASAGLLAVMPVAGAGLGVLVGLNPAHVLLHTPIGAACLCVAVVLQLAGLAWSARLSRVEVAA